MTLLKNGWRNGEIRRSTGGERHSASENPRLVMSTSTDTLVMHGHFKKGTQLLDG